tara:strand:- start:96 stop:605 length:510 start_codon:yes stop_codon:yes gene_type:complete
MENKTKNKIITIQMIENFLKKNIIFLSGILVSIVIVLISILYYDYLQSSKNEKISEKYIKAGLYLASKDIKKSKEIYKEIISNKNEFYSLLSLNNIIDNNLEQKSDEILKLFNTIESISMKKEQKNFIKLKKALYLKKLSNHKEGNDLITEIIDNNSIWKDIALEISKY